MSFLTKINKCIKSNSQLKHKAHETDYKNNHSTELLKKELGRTLQNVFIYINHLNVSIFFTSIEKKGIGSTYTI